MKQQRIVLGVTGGIATGKSTVLQELERLGVPGVSSDALARDSLRPGRPAYRRVIQRYGWKILRSSGSICREDLARIVFAHPEERKWLERQIHPDVVRQLKSFIKKKTGVIALDIPLLFEARLQKLVDVILVVGASPRVQMLRLRRRDGLALIDAKRRIDAQLPLSYKKKRADFYISNQSDRRTLRRALQQVLSRIQKRA
jgi:dephospho-CoA kinase